MEVYRRKRNCKFKCPGMDEFTRKRFTYRLGSRGFSLKVAPFCILALKSEHVHSHLYYFLLSVTCKEVLGSWVTAEGKLRKATEAQIIAKTKSMSKGGARFRTRNFSFFINFCFPLQQSIFTKPDDI